MQSPMQDLRKRREDMGISQTELAYRTGYNYTSISAWESGRVGIRLRAYIDLVNALGFDLRMTLEKREN